VFIAEQHDGELDTHPILRVADSTSFAPSRPLDLEREFTPQHWGMVEAIARDPDGRRVSLQAPVPPGVESVDADTHHEEKYGTH